MGREEDEAAFFCLLENEDHPSKASRRKRVLFTYVRSAKPSVQETRDKNSAFQNRVTQKLPDNSLGIAWNLAVSLFIPYQQNTGLIENESVMVLWVAGGRPPDEYRRSSTVPSSHQATKRTEAEVHSEMKSSTVTRGLPSC